MAEFSWLEKLINRISQIAVFLFAQGILLLAAACQAHSPGETIQRELRVVCSGGFNAAYDLLAPQFADQHGIVIHKERGASSGGAPDSIPERLARGEKFDVIILSRTSLDVLTESGLVQDGSSRDLARSLIGMAVQAGADIPDISTPERFVAILLDADSIGYSASASGTYLSTDLFPRLGLWGELEPKSHRVLSERVAAVVARGDVEIGFQQVSEILTIEGSSYVGPIPHEYQKITTFATGITANAANVADARMLIDYLSSAPVAETIESTGLIPVVLEQ